MPVFSSPTWKVRAGVGNLPTCNTLFNSRSMMYYSLRSSPFSVWRNNPAYVPINSGWGNLASVLQDASQDRPSGFTRWISPSIFKLARMHIITNEISAPGLLNIPFSIYLGEDGPVHDGLHAGKTPKKLTKLFDVKLTNHPNYTPEMTSGEMNIQMFSGHSYGYIFEMDTTPTLPTTEILSVNIGADIQFGAGGEE